MTVFNILKALSKNKNTKDKDGKKDKVFKNYMKETESKYFISNIFQPTFLNSLHWKNRNMNYNENNSKKKYFKQNIVSFFNGVSEIKKEICDIGKSFIKPSKRNLILPSRSNLKHKNSLNKSGFSRHYTTNSADINYSISLFEKKYNTYPSVLKKTKLNNSNRKRHEKITYQRYKNNNIDNKQSFFTINCNTDIDKNTNNDVLSQNSTIDLNNNNYKKKIMPTEYLNETISRKEVITSSPNYCVTFDETVTLIIFNVYDNNDYTIIHEPLKNDDYDTIFNENSTNFYSYTPTKTNYESKSDISFLDYISMDDCMDSMTITDINNNNILNF